MQTFLSKLINTTRRELFRFTQGDRVFCYTNGDREITFNNEVYTRLAISRNNIKDSGAMEKNSVDFTFAEDSKFAQDCLRSQLEENVLVTVMRYVDGEVKELWKGRFTKVKPDDSKIKLTFETDFTSLQRAGARSKFQRTCCHDLYGVGCRLNKDDWKIKTTVQSVNGLDVVVRGLEDYAENHFRLGMLQSANGVFVSIEHSAQNQITLMRRLDSLKDYIVTDEDLVKGEDLPFVYIYPGCLKTPDACNKFNNTENYLGFPNIPEKNPTTTRIV